MPFARGGAAWSPASAASAANASAVADMAQVVINKRRELESLIQTYEAIAQALTSDGILMPEEKFLLKQFRTMHDIGSAGHDRMLKTVGWSVDDFARGYKEPPEVPEEQGEDDEAGVVGEGGSPPVDKKEDSGDATDTEPRGWAKRATGLFMASNAHRLLKKKIAPIIRKRKASASSTFIELQSKTGSAQFRANAKRIAIVREIIFYIFFMLFFTMLSARWYGSERSYKYASSPRNALVETPKMAFADITSKGQAISWLTLTTQFPAGLAAEPFRN